MKDKNVFNIMESVALKEGYNKTFSILKTIRGKDIEDVFMSRQSLVLGVRSPEGCLQLEDLSKEWKRNEINNNRLIAEMYRTLTGKSLEKTTELIVGTYKVKFKMENHFPFTCIVVQRL